jgi:prephenate dehydrogenase
MGLVRRDTAIQEALAAGVVDRATMDPSLALQAADIVVLATPARTIIRQLAELAHHLRPAAIVTDMGSTKQAIVRAMDALPEAVQAVGSHPMCGKEQAGLTAADPDLYEGAPWILTPGARTLTTTTQTVADMAESVGAKTRILAADRHDKLVAAISHLPYVLAATLTLTAQRVAADDPAVWDVAASGFKDTSRVAASEVTMMVDILLTNRSTMAQMLAMARVQLDQFTQALANEDERTLRQLMDQAAQQRKLLY